MNYIDKLASSLIKGPISIIQFNNILSNSNRFFDNLDLEKELLISNGFPLYINEKMAYLKTSTNLIQDQVFCIVDIETTAEDPDKGQLIEIGAIKYKNGVILDQYHSLVNAHTIPLKIEELTGINSTMLENAPNIQTVLEEFKIFLEDDLFVAHNVKFDYNFLSKSFEKYNLGKLYNRKLCTIELAKRSFYAKRYGLDYLKEFLNINQPVQHRAFEDAESTITILEKSLKNLPKEFTTENLIDFSINADIKENNEL